MLVVGRIPLLSKMIFSHPPITLVVVVVVVVLVAVAVVVVGTLCIVVGGGNAPSECTRDECSVGCHRV